MDKCQWHKCAKSVLFGTGLGNVLPGYFRFRYMAVTQSEKQILICHRQCYINYKDKIALPCPVHFTDSCPFSYMKADWSDESRARLGSKGSEVLHSSPSFFHGWFS